MEITWVCYLLRLAWQNQETHVLFRHSKKLDNAKVYEFVTSLGITPEFEGNSKFINEAHSVGGFTGVSPVQLAAAYSAFASGGYYTKPYSYTKIIFSRIR